MRNFFNLDNPFITTLSRIGDVIILSVLWFVACVPVVTLGNATGALYETFRSVVLEEKGTLLKSFWSVYKRDWKRGCFVTALYEVVCLLLLTGLIGGYTYFREESWIGAVNLVLAIFAATILSMMLYNFLLLSCRGLSIKKQLGMAFVLCIRHFPTTLILIVMLIGSATLVEMFPLAILFLPGFFCWLAGRWLRSVEKMYPAIFGTEELDGQQLAGERMGKP